MSYDVLFHSHYIDVYINVTRSTCQVYDSNLIVVGDINFPFIIGLVSLITSLFFFNKDINSNLFLGKSRLDSLYAHYAIILISMYLFIVRGNFSLSIRTSSYLSFIVPNTFIENPLQNIITSL